LARHLPAELRVLAHIDPNPVTARAAEAAVWAATNALARTPLGSGLMLIVGSSPFVSNEAHTIAG
jgi:hypothetical protein